MRAVSRVLNIPLGTVSSWIKGVVIGGVSLLWLKARDVVESFLLMWTYLKRNHLVFYLWVWTAIVFTRLGMYVVVEVGDRNMDVFNKEKLPRAKRWVTDDYNVYFHFHTIVHYVNPNESLHSSFRDHLVRLKMIKAVNRSIEMLSNSVKMLEKGLVVKFAII